jgi:dTDP-4-dehydrorhamnose 3,5-epimerase
MIFRSTRIEGVFEICLELMHDERGFFARTWCSREFAQRGLNPGVVQCNISMNVRKGTLRGIHFQKAPHQEAKLVRCTRGRVYDVALDLRPESSTFMQWAGVELSAETGNALYIPEGCGHGFLTLEDRTELFYQMSEFHHPEAAQGVRWNDSAFQIEWPAPVEVISERDRTYPDFERND